MKPYQRTKPDGDFSYKGFLKNLCKFGKHSSEWKKLINNRGLKFKNAKAKNAFIANS